MNATTPSPVATASPQPTPVPVAGSAGTAVSLPNLQLPGSGAGAAGVEQMSTIAGPRRDSHVTVPLDAFARRGGPDVAVKTDDGLVRAHAVFSIDPTTHEMSVSVVDEAGRLIRMIPPDSVAKMIAAMATYRGR
jgi:hypothetical protein